MVETTINEVTLEKGIENYLQSASPSKSRIVRPVRQEIKPVKHRNELLTLVAEKYLWSQLRQTSVNTYEAPSLTRILIQYHKEHRHDKYGIGLLFVPLHYNFIEAMMLPAAIKEIFGGVIPYSIMNTERVQEDKYLRLLVDNVGVIGLDVDAFDAGVKVRAITDSVLSNRESLIDFAEGHRTTTGLVGDFSVSGFQGSMDAARKIRSVFIIPTNVSWPFIYEVANGSQKDYSYSDIKESLKINHGNAVVSLGDPIEVNPPRIIGMSSKEIKTVDKIYREELKNTVRDACIDLKCILPEHIHAAAIRKLNPEVGSHINCEELFDSISYVLARLEPHKKRFRGVPHGHLSERKILTRSSLQSSSYLMDQYEVYSNLIEPFLTTKSPYKS